MVSEKCEKENITQRKHNPPAPCTLWAPRLARGKGAAAWSAFGRTSPAAWAIPASPAGRPSPRARPLRPGAAAHSFGAPLALRGRRSGLSAQTLNPRDRGERGSCTSPSRPGRPKAGAAIAGQRRHRCPRLVRSAARAGSKAASREPGCAGGRRGACTRHSAPSANERRAPGRAGPIRSEEVCEWH